jgi:integrase
MPLHLVKPGERIKRVGGKDYPNRFYLVRGEIGGRSVEVSTKTTNKSSAEVFKAALEIKLLSQDPPDAGADVTFKEAADAYKAWKNPSGTQLAGLDKLLKTSLAQMRVRKIRHIDLVTTANQNPNHSAATKNRMVMRPAAAVLHYAAQNRWCEWLRIPLFKEKKPETRAVSQEQAECVIANAPGAEERLLLLWLFKMGTRITDTLNVENARINRERRYVEMYVSKTDTWRTFPIDEEVWAEYVNFTPKGEKYLFRWRSRSSVYRWWNRLCKQLGLYVTPHMGRHSMATWLVDGGADIKTLMEAGGWDDVKSVLRYIKSGVDRVRAARKNMGKLLGKSSSGARNARN